MSANNKSDYSIGSLAYMANEYDDFSVKMANFANAKQSLNNDISDLTKKIEMFNKNQIKSEEDLERLEQYGRSENLSKFTVFHLHKTKRPTKLLKKWQMCLK